MNMQKLGLKKYKFVNATGLNNADLKGKHPEGTDPNAENSMSPRYGYTFKSNDYKVSRNARGYKTKI